MQWINSVCVCLLMRLSERLEIWHGGHESQDTKEGKEEIRDNPSSQLSFCCSFAFMYVIGRDLKPSAKM